MRTHTRYKWNIMRSCDTTLSINSIVATRLNSVDAAHANVPTHSSQNKRPKTARRQSA